MYCSNCGNKIDGAVKFCSSCGSGIDVKTTKVQTQKIRQSHSTYTDSVVDDRPLVTRSDLETGVELVAIGAYYYVLYWAIAIGVGLLLLIIFLFVIL